MVGGPGPVLAASPIRVRALVAQIRVVDQWIWLAEDDRGRSRGRKANLAYEIGTKLE